MPAHHTPILLGTREVWGQDYLVSYTVPERRHHTYILGKSGTGKTTLLKSLIVQDIHAGRGVGFIDPHGDAAQELLDLIPSWRTEDVIYFNAGDVEYPMAWNLLHAEHRGQHHLVADAIVGAFRNIWGYSWGPQLEFILLASVKTLLDVGTTSLLGISRLLGDTRFRKELVRKIKDPALGQWWEDFERRSSREQTEAIAPVQNKVGRLMLDPTLRHIFGQTHSRITPHMVMDTNKIFICNLSKGIIGADTAHLLGALLISQFQQAALSRATQPEEERVDWALIIDEFQSFSTSAFLEMLAVCRKYHLSLTMSHQYLEQIDDKIRAAIFGNVGTWITFQVGEADGTLLTQAYGDGLVRQHFTDLNRHEVLIKMQGGQGSAESFRAKTLLPDTQRYGRSARIVRRSRQRWATRRAVVANKLERWLSP